MLEKLEAAIARKLISRPQFQQQPETIPLHAAVCAIDLPNGCSPPISGAARRVATGCSFNSEEAGFLAMAEGAERYSLQFSEDRPLKMSPFHSNRKPPVWVPTERLTLGAPVSNGTVDSKGCAAGGDLEDAGIRAVLEALEHRAASAMLNGKLPCHSEPSENSDLSTLDDWLSAQFRRLSHLVYHSPAGFTVALSRCADFNDGRPTYGSAAKCEPDDAILSASLEAIFHWRNMIQIEVSGTTFKQQTSEELNALTEYRGAGPRRTWPKVRRNDFMRYCPSAIDLDQLMTELTDLSGKNVSLFNMSTQDIEVPVVRTLLHGNFS